MDQSAPSFDGCISLSTEYVFDLNVSRAFGSNQRRIAMHHSWGIIHANRCLSIIACPFSFLSSLPVLALRARGL